MKVYFFPPSSEQNISINMIVEGLEYNGVEVVNKKYKNALIVMLGRKMCFLSAEELIMQFLWKDH